MKPTFFQVGKEGVLPELVKYLAYGLNVRLSRVLSIDQYVIQIYDNNNI